MFPRRGESQGLGSPCGPNLFVLLLGSVAFSEGFHACAMRTRGRRSLCSRSLCRVLTPKPWRPRTARSGALQLPGRLGRSGEDWPPPCTPAPSGAPWSRGLSALRFFWNTLACPPTLYCGNFQPHRKVELHNEQRCPFSGLPSSLTFRVRERSPLRHSFLLLGVFLSKSWLSAPFPSEVPND